MKDACKVGKKKNRNLSFAKLFLTIWTVLNRTSDAMDGGSRALHGCTCARSGAKYAHIVKKNNLVKLRLEGNLEEILGLRLNTIHNLRYYQRLMREIRQAVQ